MGNRGGAFPGRGRGAKYVSTTNSESSVTLNFSVQVSSATHATEVQHGNVNVNRGRGSRGRRGFQPHVGSDRGKAHAKSKGSFQPPKHSSVPCKDGGSVMVQQRRETNQDSSKQASKTVNTSASFCKPQEKSTVGKTASSYRGRQRGGKGNPNQGHSRQMDNSAKSGGSGSQRSTARKMDNMKKSVSCGICLEVWTRPKTLPCDHVFCEKCLEKIIIHRRQVVTCPECRQEHTLPSQGLRNSWFTHRYLESLADDFKDLKT